MSSLNDSSGAASHNDSIPLDGEESSMTLYSDEEEGGIGVDADPSSQLSDDAPSSLDYSSVSRTYLSNSRASGRRAVSEDYTGTASYYSNGGATSNSYGYDDEDYSSGYGSLTYGDSALRSPQSELSSTFASLYYENRFVVSTRATLHFLRRPLYYFAFATAGSGALGSVCRLATTFARRCADGGAAMADPSLGAYPGSAASCAAATEVGGLPAGYPAVPGWLRDVRASLPGVLEVPAAWMLRRHGIPVLSEVLQRQHAESATAAAAAAAAAAMAAQVRSGVQEVWQVWQRTGPAIPVALFLPVFSLVVFKVAQHVRPSPMNFTELLQLQDAPGDVDGGSTFVSTPSPSRPTMSVDASPIPIASSSPGNTSAQSASAVAAPLTSRGTPSASRSRYGGGDGGAEGPPTVPPVDMGAVTGVSPSSPDDYAGEPRERSRSTTQAPLTYRHVAEGVAADAVAPGAEQAADDGEDGEVVDVDVDVGAAQLSPISPPPAAGDYDAAAKPYVSPPPRVPGARADGGRLVSAKDSTLSGDVVAAVAGDVDVREANVAVMAAVRYGCSGVVLPAALRTAAGLLETPPSLTVEFADDVLVTATLLASRRGLRIVGVTAQQWDAQSVPLDGYVHPGNALYVFVAHESANPAVVEEMEDLVQQSVFVDTARTEVPVNQLFYDRLQKEKTSAAAAAPPAPPSSRSSH